MTKTELQSLFGKLLYISKIIKPARAFLNRMLQTLRDSKDSKHITLTDDFYKDLLWFRTFLKDFNGCTTYKNWNGQFDQIAFVDASLHGLGAVMGKHFYTAPLPNYIKDLNRIVVFEMLNILVLCLVWGPRLKNSRLKLYCDNSAVVQVFQGNKTKDRTLGAILREVLMCNARHNIQMLVAHVQGKQNPNADALSRVHMEKASTCKTSLLGQNYRETKVKDDMFLI